ncbi:MAG: acetylxylan esterase [Chloroflexi bacterium]|nr:acetylxylan esterase [Chloroflexota bacterium]OJV88980.1 MAG: hypothetical protein BGO39_32775 [Chloroflexi bacterium 54-19]
METAEEIRQNANYDESKVPAYTLPDPLLLPEGHPVTDAATWFEKARPATYLLFETLMYGRTPDKNIPIRAEVLRTNPQALGGKATTLQTRLYLGERSDTYMDLLTFLPNGASGPVPLFLGLSFSGNHTVSHEPDVPVTESWVRDLPDLGQVNHRATEATRGIGTENWQAELLVERGYGLTTIYYGDIDPDFDDGFQNGIHPLFYAEGQTRPGPGEWGSIGAWAWGLSRALDYLETLPAVDAKKVAVIGHSRLGKTALWAAAQDQRFALAISNNSGSGGAAIGRRMFGETYAHLNTAFPHWFSQTFHAYSYREADLPFDQHQLLALVAPRPLYVASASEDLWADPYGEYLATEHVRPVYNLLAGEDAAKRIGYHKRPGGHDINRYDWERYLDFADANLR